MLATLLIIRNRPVVLHRESAVLVRKAKVKSDHSRDLPRVALRLVRKAAG